MLKRRQILLAEKENLKQDLQELDQLKELLGIIKSEGQHNSQMASRRQAETNRVEVNQIPTINIEESALIPDSATDINSKDQSQNRFLFQKGLDSPSPSRSETKEAGKSTDSNKDVRRK
jgi:hypothetical protein